MDKQNYLQHLSHDIYFRIQPSPIHGVGIFAIRDIPVDTDPFLLNKDLDWVEFNRADFEGLPEYVKKIINDFYYGEGDKVWLPAQGLNVFDISFYINHSDKPNMITKDGGETFVTARDIKEGEELTSDYNTYY